MPRPALVLAMVVLAVAARPSAPAAQQCLLGIPLCCADDAQCDDGDPCNGPEVCDVLTGTCAVGTPPADPVPCDDADACTTGDRCIAGVCTGDPVVCAAIDQCHAAGVCVPTTGLCTSPPSADGMPCDDG